MKLGGDQLGCSLFTFKLHLLMSARGDAGEQKEWNELLVSCCFSFACHNEFMLLLFPSASLFLPSGYLQRSQWILLLLFWGAVTMARKLDSVRGEVRNTRLNISCLFCLKPQLPGCEQGAAKGAPAFQRVSLKPFLLESWRLLAIQLWCYRCCGIPKTCRKGVYGLLGGI